MSSGDDWSLWASKEDVEVFIWVEDVISVDIPIEWILDEGVDCTTFDEEIRFFNF